MPVCVHAMLQASCCVSWLLRFDSNCITPGTEFMWRLQQHLEFFVNKKLSTDPSWQKVEIILSGQDVRLPDLFLVQ